MGLGKTPTQTPVAHGGDLWRAMQRYGGTPSEWLDLSTGINPHAYPVPPLPEDIWRCLPNDHDGLLEIAARYYGLSEQQALLAVPGSQYAIRHLPALLSPGAVGIADLTYGEYAPAFLRAGHAVVRYRYPDSAASQTDSPLFILHPDHALPEALRYLVVVNPNNPTTDHHSVSSLLKWRDTLHGRGGMLIVDEAFADVDPSRSVLQAFASRSSPRGVRKNMRSDDGENDNANANANDNANADDPDTLDNDGSDDRSADVRSEQSARHIERDFAGLLVLRSVGKFFGLAGIRAGLVMGPASVLDDLSQQMGAWAVSGPARHAMRHAFADGAWQAAMRARLTTQSAATMALLARHRLNGRATSLFIWLPHPHAAALQQGLAQYRIWTRLFAPCTSSGGDASLRLGIPADTGDLARLDQALSQLESIISA